MKLNKKIFIILFLILSFFILTNKSLADSTNSFTFSGKNGSSYTIETDSYYKLNNYSYIIVYTGSDESFDKYQIFFTNSSERFLAIVPYSDTYQIKVFTDESCSVADGYLHWYDVKIDIASDSVSSASHSYSGNSTWFRYDYEVLFYTGNCLDKSEKNFFPVPEVDKVGLLPVEAILPTPSLEIIKKGLKVLIPIALMVFSALLSPFLIKSVIYRHL